MRDSHRLDGGFDAETTRKLRRADSLIQYFQQASERRTTLQLNTLLSSNTKTIFLDEQKKYVIVDHQYLESLQNDLAKAKADVEDLMAAIKKEQSIKAEQSKLILLKEKQINSLRTQYENHLDEKIKVERRILDSQLMIDTKQIEYYQLSENYLRVLAEKQQLMAFQQYYHSIFTRPREEKEVQTVYDLVSQCQQPKSSTGAIEQKKSQMKANTSKQSGESSSKLQVELALAQKYELEIQALKKSFAEVLEDVKKQTNQKLLTIQQQKIGVERWSLENRRLQAENEELKKTIKQINQKEEKLKIWKSTLENYVEGVERDHSAEPESVLGDAASPGRQSFSSEQKIKLLMITIDRLKMQREERNKRLEDVRLILDKAVDPSAVSEENIVGTLLNLSARVKEGLKCLLGGL